MKATPSQRPDPIPGVTWVQLECPVCRGPWWLGQDDESTIQDGAQVFAAMVGMCADCRSAAEHQQERQRRSAVAARRKATKAARRGNRRR